MIRSRRVLRLLLLFWIGGTFHYAEATGTEDLRELSIEELMNTEVISSTQQSVPFLEAPSTMFVVTGDQIRRWGIRRLSELVERLVPGAVAAEDIDDIILGFRGITADNNLKVLLQLNGHDYNTQWNNGPSSENELGLMDDISKVEILIGPHGALYGSGALLAVINVITRNGGDFSGIRATGNYGTGDYKRAELTAGDRVNSDLDYFFSAGGLSADGYENNNNGPQNLSRYLPSWRFYGDFNYKEFELMTRFTRSARALYNRPYSTVNPNLWTNYDTFFVDGKQNFQFNNKLKGILNLSYDSIQTQRHDFTLGTKLRAVGEDRYSIKFTSFYSGMNKNNILLGAYYRRDEFGEDWVGDNFNFSTQIVNGVVTGIPADPYTKRTITPYGRNAYALFGQDSIRFNDEYSLLLGFRFDRIEAPQIDHPNSFTPRVALVVTPNPKTVLKAMFTSGLSRQPNAVLTSPDSFGFGIPQITRIENPERMYSFELSGSYEASSKLDLTLNVYYNSLRNIFGPASKNPIPPAPGPQVILSDGRIDYVGFEAIINANLTDRTFVRAMHQHVQFGSVVNDVLVMLTTPDEHMLAYPQDVTKFLTEARINKNLSVNANAQLVWNDFGYIVPTGEIIESGFYALLNANLVWDATPHIQIILSGYNLFDEQKQIPAYDGFSYLAERNFNLNFSFRY